MYHNILKGYAEDYCYEAGSKKLDYKQLQISTSESKHFRPLMNDLKMIEKIFRVCEEHYLCDEQLQISLMKNATNYRTYFSIKQTFLNKFFENQHSGQCHLVNNLFDKNLVTSLDHLLEDDAKFSSCFNKNIPRVVSLGLNIVFDIIKDSYEKNPDVCIRSLHSLYNLLQSLKPESLKYEPPIMIEKFFDLIAYLITCSYSTIIRKGSPSTLRDNYHCQVLEQSILSFITMSIARGETAKILNCIKTLVIECNDTNTLLDNYNMCNSNFNLEIPEILIFLKKNVCATLLGRNNYPEWCLMGFPPKSLCESFVIDYAYQKKNCTNNNVVTFKSKSNCSTSIAFDGQYLFLYRCNRIHLIGTGYNNTPLGQELYSSLVEHSSLTDNTKNDCCSFGGWIGFISGELFVQPNSNWSMNQIMHFDHRSIEFKSTISLICDPVAYNGVPFSDTTLATTDGDYLILITPVEEDYFVIRELKPLKVILEPNNPTCKKEKVTFSLSSEYTVRLSSSRVSLYGNSNFNIPSYDLINRSESDNIDTNDRLMYARLKVIETNNLFELKEVVNVLTGKEFALLLTGQGKVYYCGNSQNIGLPQTNSLDKWSQLEFPKPVKIVQIAVGHESNHALMMGEDGSLFFVGVGFNGQDGFAGPHRCQKPYKVKKFRTVSMSDFVIFAACNQNFSSVVNSSGELYLYGRDTLDYKYGKDYPFLKNYPIKSISFGKAHMLILYSDGFVVTRLFTQKCLYGHSCRSTKPEKLSKGMSNLHFGSTEFKNVHFANYKKDNLGHLFIEGKSRKCTCCKKCTGKGLKCWANSSYRVLCGCKESTLTCLFCGVCVSCAKEHCGFKSDDEDALDQMDEVTVLQMKTIDEVVDWKLLGTKFQEIQQSLDENLLEFIQEQDCHRYRDLYKDLPLRVMPLKARIVQIATGLNHSVLLSSCGEVFTFGSNQYGQLGHGDFIKRFVPTKVLIKCVTKGYITQISAGSNHTVLLTSLGEVLTFGNYQHGQLGRCCYNSCKLDCAWNSFPGKMENVGPEFGRLVTFVSASGDFTFFKYDENLFSANKFNTAKLMIEKNNLILISPKVSHKKNFDELFEEKSCKHEYCKALEGTSIYSSEQNGFNNLNTNVLLISRTNGTCSIMNPSSSSKLEKLTNHCELNNQLIFNQYSSLLIDKYYHNLWTFNSFRNEISRFNLISMESSIKMSLIHKERYKSSAHYEEKFPNSLINLYQLNTHNSSVNQYLKCVPSVLQPDMAVPLSDYSLIRKTPQQLGLELFTLLTSLTYTRMLGISPNDKTDDDTFLTQSLMPKEYHSVCRFSNYGGGWGYSPNSVDAIRFSADYDILLGGISVFGGRGEYAVQIRVIDIGYEGYDVEIEGDLLTETDIVHYECAPLQKFQILFDEPVLIQANRWYVITTSFNGPSSDCGSYGSAFISTPEQVIFQFKSSKLSNNGTDVNCGQIPELLYKVLVSNDIQYNNIYGNMNSALQFDDDGIPFSISKDFVLRIDSSCINTLREISNYSWNSLKNLLLESKLIEIFSNQDREKIVEKLNNLIVEIRKHIYMLCLSFELIRAYVHLILPLNDVDFGTNSKKSNFPRYGHGLKYPEKEKLKEIADSLYNICILFKSFLTNPIDIGEFLLKQIDVNRKNSVLQRKLSTIAKMNNYFLDECHHTFLICCGAFYPSNVLRWSLLCDLLYSDDDIDKMNSNNSICYTNKQLYLLSAVINAFSSPTIKLSSFFPIFHGSIAETFEDLDDDLNSFLTSVSDYTDFSGHLIAKRLTELFNFSDTFLRSKYSSSFIFDSLLQIIVEPIIFTITNLKTTSVESSTSTNEYKQLENVHLKNSNSLYDLPSSFTSSSSSFEDYILNENKNDLSERDAAINRDLDEDSTPSDSQNLKTIFVNSRQYYSEKLLIGASDFLIKFISELNANTRGLLSHQLCNDSLAFFNTNNEYITPSRFCRRSSTKCWETGSGSPEAICFTVNKYGIYISGIRIYSCATNRFKYQLQLFDQVDECWRTLSTVSAIYSIDDNCQNKDNDYYDLRFERPYLLQPFAKYSVLLKNYSTYSFSGDMGLGQVRGDDDTLFTFMDCSLSKNGTNLNRGQIPQILYYNIPLEQQKPAYINNKNASMSFNSNLASESIVAMFQSTAELAIKVLKSAEQFISQLSVRTESSNSSTSSNYSLDVTEMQLLKLLYSIFNSKFFYKFIPSMIIHLQPILNSCSVAYQILLSVRPIILLISSLNKFLINYFPRFNFCSVGTTASQCIVVESDHPYKKPNVSSYYVKFPTTVKSMWIEFDAKCSTSKAEDILELYIPSESYQAKDSSNKDCNSFYDLTKIYKEFNGKGFSKNISSILKNSNPFSAKLSMENSLFVPGNELVFLFKTNNDNDNSVYSSDEANYGFKAQVFSYELPLKPVDLSESESLTETLLHNIKQLIEYFESNLIYLSGQCVHTLMNASPANLIEKFVATDPLFNINTKLKSQFEKYDFSDTDFAKQIYNENISVLFKNLNFDQQLTLEMLTKCEFPEATVHPFLDDFIKLNPQTSGSRLALWFQSESFILPNSCVLNLIDSIDFCCEICSELLQSTDFASTIMLCSSCHYQLFVKTISQTNENKMIPVDKKVFIKIVTRDQHQEIAYDHNARVEVNIHFISPFSQENDVHYGSFDARHRRSNDKSSLFSNILENPYQIIVKDKVRYHSITMMKSYENFSLEELRFHTQSYLSRNSVVENIQLRSFENGYYLASWTPTSTGCYKIDLAVDGECSNHSNLINIVDEDDDRSGKSFSPSNREDHAKRSVTFNNDYEISDRATIKHCIRKFICHDSAGLRIRALPSLQSEQIGVVAINGLLTIIDQCENDDGLWVRLSNESIQAYCGNSVEVYHQTNKDFLADNYDVNEPLTSDSKSPFSITIRTEAWALQYNRHFNRTLLIPIDSEDDIVLRDKCLFDQTQRKLSETLITPSWFQVVNCGQDGHLIRNAPSLEDVSIIIGIVPFGESLNAVEAIRNEYGIWIRLSQDSLHAHISVLYQSTFNESNIEGWMLAQSINGLVYLQNVDLKMDNKELKYSDSCVINNNKYNLNDDNNYTVVAKHAISNNTAQCIRAIFAAFVWHEGILHDVFTAASYLKFNAEITKELVKCHNVVKNVSNQTNLMRQNRKSSKNQKTIFRHSVEVSQLLALWSSDVNSNVSDMFNIPLMENNNNEMSNINNNNNMEVVVEGNLDETREQGSLTEDLVMIPELLVNLLKIWEFVSSECMKLFANFTHMNSHVLSINSDKNQNLNWKEDSISKNSLVKQVVLNQNYAQVPETNLNAGISIRARKCVPNNNEQDISSDNHNEMLEVRGLKYLKYKMLSKRLIDNDVYPKIMHNVNLPRRVPNRKFGLRFEPEALKEVEPQVKDENCQKHLTINNIQQLYETLKSSAYYLLMLIPSIEPSLTGVNVTESNIVDNPPVTDCQTQVYFHDFIVDEPYNFQSLHQLGIQKSVYEEKLAEEKLSDLAILSIQNGDDYQNLLSPEYLKLFDGEEKVEPISNENRKSFKFHRSISVGLHESKISNSKIKKSFNMPNYNRMQNKSSETLDSDCDSKFNMPFLCKPSSRLMCLTQTYVDSNPSEKDVFVNSVVVSNFKSTLFNLNVFRFIFSCYNIDMYRLVSKSAISAAAYRAIALNALDWLITNSTCASNLHDLMWTFVYSLLPDISIKGDFEEKENIKDAHCSNQFENSEVDSKTKHINVDVCQHPFNNLSFAGNSAEYWITSSLHRFIKSISNLLSLLPMGSPLQQMAIRCFGVDFQPSEHIFLHECKVFSHISAILARSSVDDSKLMYSGTDNSLVEINNIHSLIDMSKDLSSKFQIFTSSSQEMIPCLLDNSTETFWESASTDSRKHLLIKRNRNEDNDDNLFENHRIKFVCLNIDNIHDKGYYIYGLTFKVVTLKNDFIKNSEHEIEKFEKIKDFDLKNHSCGWIQCELTSQQSDEICLLDRQLKIEINGLSNPVRIRQVKLLSISNYFDQFALSELCSRLTSNKYPNSYPRLNTSSNFIPIQISNCEAETLQVFRLLTSQVFGKLLSNESSTLSNNENRLSFYQNTENLNSNENDLKQHMVGILFSHCGRLSELQIQVCSHFVKEIHCESTKSSEEWENSFNLMQYSSVDADKIKGQNDSYCFEILSLVLALSGTDVGSNYLSEQNSLLYDIITLLHTSSDRVKRQVLSILRRLLSRIKPSLLSKLLGLKQSNQKFSLDVSENENDEILNHVGLLDIFLACIAKSLNVQIKIKGLTSESRSLQMSAQFKNNGSTFGQWWLKGATSKQISNSIITVLKDMISGRFGNQWSDVALNSVREKILNMTRLPTQYHLSDESCKTPTLWLTLASLCVLGEKDAEKLFSNDLSLFHDQANGNSHVYCDNHDDGETVAYIQCDVCGNLCSDCERFLHLNTKTRVHKRNLIIEKDDLIKVDIHEGCGRVKFLWSLAVADAKSLKAMVEFRNSNLKFSDSNDNAGSNVSSYVCPVGVCRFCGVNDYIETSSVGNVCSRETCQTFSKQVCTNIIRCGHNCNGIRNENNCLPCLYGCSSNIKQDGDDMCMVCFTESLFAAPCIQLACKHVFHFHCIKTMLEKRWVGSRITFTFYQCPICKATIEHDSLSEILQPIKELYEDVKRKALMRLEYEGHHMCNAITAPGSRFYLDPAAFAIEKYSYYLCFKCGKAYYGGEARCDADFDTEKFNPEELICGRCSDVTQAQICPKHGTEYLEYKCRYCCSVAVYFCFGTTHFCAKCHDDFQHITMIRPVNCPAGPRAVQLEGECPLHVQHPPTGQEFALGCGICRNAHFF